MNRAERRRQEREKERYPYPNPNIHAAVTNAVMNKRNRDEAILATAGPMLETVYAAVILLMVEEYGFDHDQCLNLLTKLEDKTLYCFDHKDIVNEAFDKIGIRINFNAGLDRIEEI